jgi:hypothetical protein
MGIDIYAEWRGMSDEEREVQVTGFSVVRGHVGHLSEPEDGEPYATRVLVPEAFQIGNAARAVIRCVSVVFPLRIIELRRAPLDDDVAVGLFPVIDAWLVDFGTSGRDRRDVVQKALGLEIPPAARAC